MRIIPINNYNIYNKNFKKNETKNNQNKLTSTPLENIQYKYNITFSGLYSSTQTNEIQKVENALLKQNSTSSGVGFYGPKTKTMENLFEGFVKKMAEGGYDIIKIPTEDEAEAEEIALAISNGLKSAESKYKQTGVKSLLVIRDLDEISKNNKIMRNLMSMENFSDRGFAWVWDAKDKNNIDKSLIRRTTDFILVRPAVEDSKEVWDNYINIVSAMPESEKRRALLNDAASAKPKIFPFNIQSVHQNKIEGLMSKFGIARRKTPEKKEKLSDYKEQTAFFIDNLSSMQNIKDVIKKAKIGEKPLIDFWLTQAGENPSEYTARLKDNWLENTLKNEDKTNQLIKDTLAIMENENDLIRTARESYTDILENETELNDNQKDILKKQQDSKLFFLVISNNLEPQDSIKLQLNVIRTVKQLSTERKAIIENARNSIFNSLGNIKVLQSNDTDDVENVSFVFDLLSDKINTLTETEREELKSQITRFEQAKKQGNKKTVQEEWRSLVRTAQDYFENTKTDEITDRSIKLLYSIQKNYSSEDSKTIQDILNGNSYSIEQKDFISRYKNDSNLLLLLDNPNVNKKEAIDELLYIETFNNKIMSEILRADKTIASEKDFNEKFAAWQNNELKPFISKKMLEYNQEYDINYQGREICSKLDTITQTIGNQTDAINDFATNFADYTSSSLSLQTSQLNQMIKMTNVLNSIETNTKNASAYTQALTRAKLAELEKNKYYKDIVPELTKLLPANEQIDLKDFLVKVDELAKNEKSSIRKKRILKAAAIVTTVASVGTLTYFAGPAIVAHLASGTVAAGSTIANGSIAKTGAIISSGLQTANIGKKLKTNGLINFLGRTTKQITDEIRRVENELKFLRNQLLKYPNDTHYASRYDHLQKVLDKLHEELRKAID